MLHTPGLHVAGPQACGEQRGLAGGPGAQECGWLASRFRYDSFLVFSWRVHFAFVPESMAKGSSAGFT